MSVDDRRNYWNYAREQDHRDWWRDVLSWVGIIILCLMCSVFYLWGRKDGLNYARTVACDHELAHIEEPALCGHERERR